MPVVITIGALIFLAGVLYLVYHYEQARWIVAAGIAALVLAVIVWVMLTESEEQAELTRISPDQITLEVMFEPVKPGGYTPRGYNRYTVKGRLFNNADAYTLTEIGLRVRIEDCPAAETDSEETATECTVVSEGRTDIGIRIPPKQARDFVDEVQMPQFAPRGDTQWNWTVEYIRAE